MSVRTAAWLCALVLGVLAPSGVGAVPLAFTGTHEVRFDTLGVSLSANGAGVANVDTGSAPASFTLPASVFNFAAGTATSVNGDSLSLTGMNVLGNFGGPSGGFGGAMGVAGGLIYSMSRTFITTSFSTSTTTISFVWNASVLGGGGTTTATTTLGGQNLVGTAVGGIFGTGTVAGVAGFDNRVGGVGVLQMVAPISIISGEIPGGQADGVVVLTLTFVPEPATGVLCGLGAAVLGWIGRCRRLERRAG